MARAFPLSYVDFFDGLCIAGMSFSLTDDAASNRTQGGGSVDVSMAPRLWDMSVAMPLRSNAEAHRVTALIELLRKPGASFIGGPRFYAGPFLDPNGVTLGASAPTLASVDSNKRDIAIAGLPAGYVLSIGDYLSWEYGASSYALHRCVGTATANGSGQIAAIEVDPVVRPGWSAGASVRLIKPRAKFVMLPQSFTPASHRVVVADGMAFSARQVLT